jgi:N-acyl-D-amino-acid deacylase
VAWSLLIRGGSVIDGTGAAARRADVAIDGERIAAIGPDLRGEAGRVIDATGQAVAPGFIDAHSHSDLFYFACPSAESKIRQGVTTEVVGMCGFSQGPVRPGQEEVVRGWAGGIVGSDIYLDLRWETFRQYLDALASVRPAVNVAHLVGHGALRIAAMGFQDRPAEAGDLKGMEHLLGEAMDAGAFGFSTGLVYAPSAYSDTRELIALAKSMRARNGLYFSHIRGESAMLLDSIAEALRIGDEGGVGVQVSHVKASGKENWPLIDSALRMLEDAKARGVDVLGDVYPYNAGSTKLDNLMPAWAQDGGIDKLIERLSDRASRRKIAEECLVDGERWRTGGSGEVGFDQVFIASCKRRELEGLSLAQIARQSGIAPVDTLMSLLVEQKCTIGMVSFTQSLENVAKVLAHPMLMIGSDSIPLFEGDADKPGKPHPRTYGTFPRILGEYARDRRLMPLETAVHKMTGMAAHRLRLTDRGVLREGFAADVTVFDPATVKDESTYADPHRYPTGIPYVIVNGAVAVDAGRMSEARAGQILRAPR